MANHNIPATIWPETLAKYTKIVKLYHKLLPSGCSTKQLIWIISALTDTNLGSVSHIVNTYKNRPLPPVKQLRKAKQKRGCNA